LPTGLMSAGLNETWRWWRRAGCRGGSPASSPQLAAPTKRPAAASGVTTAATTIVECGSELREDRELRAPLATIHARLRAREAPRSSDWYVYVAGHLVDRLESAGVDDHVVDNDDRHPGEVASAILRLVGWLP
jgi:hypothetical protein